jgi:hypothetical protein
MSHTHPINLLYLPDIDEISPDEDEHMASAALQNTTVTK